MEQISQIIAWQANNEDSKSIFLKTGALGDASGHQNMLMALYAIIEILQLAR